MAEFCEDCPIKGDCTQDIVAVYTMISQTEAVISDDRTSARLTCVDGEPLGPTKIQARYVDEAGRLSRMVEVEGISGGDAKDNAVQFIDSLAACQRPRATKFLGLVVKRVCGAATD